MTSINGRFPARPLFSIHAEKMASNALRHSGPMGERIMSSPTGGAVQGPALNGRLLPGLASEWQLESATTPGLAWVEGLLSIQPDIGEAVLVKYVGRRSTRYGGQGYRIAMTFDAPADGPHDGLNDVVAVGQVEVRGDDVHFDIHELLSRLSPPDGNALPVELLYEMVAASSVGERHVIHSPIASRYLTIAEEGCDVTGRLKAQWPAGFAWGAHRVAASGEGHNLPLHIDMRPGLRTSDGEALIQHYIGTTPRAVLDPSPDADRSWLTVAAFEAPATGPSAYLNEVLALGIGWVENGEARYEYHIWS